MDYFFKKINETDILEILTEHHMPPSFTGEARELILGTPGTDLRFIGVYAPDRTEDQGEGEGMEQEIERIMAVHREIDAIDLEKVDREMQFNGDHASSDDRSCGSSISIRRLLSL